LVNNEANKKPTKNILVKIYLWITRWIALRSFGDKRFGNPQPVFYPEAVLHSYKRYASIYSERKHLMKIRFTELSTGKAGR